MTDEEILDSIQTEHNLPIDGSVTLLQSHYLEDHRKQSIVAWCEAHEWNVADCNDMYGSESSVIVAFEFDWAEIEYYSRAKSHLIIVTR